ncbi:ABC transporter ATP-binding protein [Idiomarina sp. MD25a]|uniref:ABC transporter ATP-binding protein/permease n=1 Tax=Idiomarina sp. MD25a TaxID=1889913 RepID=UPI0008F953B1|nr:ABC transporter transmembrane domain-containing protein [Idiomarina sp. MD25a]OIM98036.1 ABC transporter ATP-binding protein [Idiomarina sp. MD25a]
MSDNFRSAANYLKQIQTVAQRSTRRALLFGVLHTASVILQLYVIAQLAYELLALKQPLNDLTLYWVLLLTASFARGLFSWQREIWQSEAAGEAMHHARKALLRRWQCQCRQGSDIDRGDGSMLVDTVEQLRGYYERYLVQQYLTVLSPLMILVMCFWLNPVVGVLLLIAGPIIPLFMALVGMGAERVSQRHAQSNVALSRVFTSMLKNATSIKLFDGLSFANNRIAEAGETYRRANMKTLKLAFLSSAVLEFFSSVAIAAVALYVGFGLLGYINWLGADELTLFSGLLVLMLAPEYFAPLRQFAQTYHDRAAAIGAATLLAEYEQHEVNNNVAKAVSGDCVAIRGLEAVITPDSLLSYRDFRFPKGALTVISGPSGSGKSTLLRVLLGLQNYHGTVLRDKDSDQPIAYFSQQPFLLPATIRTNLFLYSEDRPRDPQPILQRVGLDKAIAVAPSGLDTMLGERGAGLSGGEQRRLALARCLLSSYPLIILDEPTENLDAESAAVIRRELCNLCKEGRTVIVASHDEALIALADQRFELDAGGSHG